MESLARLLLLLLLVTSVHCKMTDLDCALFNPLHCQTLLESDDNHFGYVELEARIPQPLALSAPELPVLGSYGQSAPGPSFENPFGMTEFELGPDSQQRPPPPFPT